MLLQSKSSTAERVGLSNWLLKSRNLRIIVEPMLRRPWAATGCFYENRLDCPAVGNLVVEKNAASNALARPALVSAPRVIAWISDFPLEWLPEVPKELKHSPRRHPTTWEMVLLDEFVKDPKLKVHVIALRHRIRRSMSFEQNGAFFHVVKASPLLRVASVFLFDRFLIARKCREIGPALVHAWGMEKGAGAVAAGLRYPYVMTVQALYAWYEKIVPFKGYDRFMARLDRIYLPRAPVVTTESRFAVGFLK